MQNKSKKVKLHHIKKFRRFSVNTTSYYKYAIMNNIKMNNIKNYIMLSIIKNEKILR